MNFLTINGNATPGPPPYEEYAVCRMRGRKPPNSARLKRWSSDKFRAERVEFRHCPGWGQTADYITTRTDELF